MKKLFITLLASCAATSMLSAAPRIYNPGFEEPGKGWKHAPEYSMIAGGGINNSGALYINRTQDPKVSGWAWQFISVEGGKMRLSLHKGGTRPDFEGDRGVHRTVYSFLPHAGGFGAETVIRPAYELNLPVVTGRGDFEAIALVVPEAENVIVEAIKPCEDNEKAFIARIYEAEGTYVKCPVKFFEGAKKIEITNMLEEVESELEGNLLEFRPFEIKTLKISY
jgi:hypothetical protein